MELRISGDGISLLQSLASELLLGIATVDGELRFHVADMKVYRGHGEWIERESIARSEIARGFSILVKEGQVVALFPMSELNPPPDHSLDEGEIHRITELLPLSGEFRIFQ